MKVCDRDVTSVDKETSVAVGVDCSYVDFALFGKACCERGDSEFGQALLNQPLVEIEMVGGKAREPNSRLSVVAVVVVVLNGIVVVVVVISLSLRSLLMQ